MYYITQVKEDYEKGAFRPNIPENMPFCAYFSNGNYLIKTDQEIDGLSSLSEEELVNECANRGIDLQIVLSW